MKTGRRLIAGVILDFISSLIILSSYFAQNRAFALFSFGIGFIIILFSISLYSNPVFNNNSKIIKYTTSIINFKIIFFVISLFLFIASIFFLYYIIVILLYILIIFNFGRLIYKEYAKCDKIGKEKENIQLKLNANVKSLLSVIISILTITMIYAIGQNLYLLILIPFVFIEFYLSYSRLVFCQVFDSQKIIKIFIFEKVFLILAYSLAVLTTQSSNGHISINIIAFIFTILLHIPTFKTNNKIGKANKNLKKYTLLNK